MTTRRQRDLTYDPYKDMWHDWQDMGATGKTSKALYDHEAWKESQRAPGQPPLEPNLAMQVLQKVAAEVGSLVKPVRVDRHSDEFTVAFQPWLEGLAMNDKLHILGIGLDELTREAQAYMERQAPALSYMFDYYQTADTINTYASWDPVNGVPHEMAGLDMSEALVFTLPLGAPIWIANKIIAPRRNSQDRPLMDQQSRLGRVDDSMALYDAFSLTVNFALRAAFIGSDAKHVPSALAGDSIPGLQLLAEVLGIPFDIDSILIGMLSWGEYDSQMRDEFARVWSRELHLKALEDELLGHTWDAPPAEKDVDPRGLWRLLYEEQILHFRRRV